MIFSIYDELCSYVSTAFSSELQFSILRRISKQLAA